MELKIAKFEYGDARPAMNAVRPKSARMGYECFPAMREGSSHQGSFWNPFYWKGGK